MVVDNEVERCWIEEEEEELPLVLLSLLLPQLLIIAPKVSRLEAKGLEDEADEELLVFRRLLLDNCGIISS
jgi:hypothetical protein